MKENNMKKVCKVGIIVCMLLMCFKCRFVTTYAEESNMLSFCTEQPQLNKEITVQISEEVSTNNDTVVKWFVGNNEVSAGLTYTPKEADLEQWIRVELQKADGTILDKQQLYFSKLPVVYINTDDGEAVTTKDAKGASMSIQGNDQWKDQYSGDIEIKVRGNSSSYFAQKPYKVKLDTSTNLFGMGKNKHWVLISNYMDQCGMRNKYGSELSAKLGLNNMSIVWVDVVLNGTYVGMYNLTEHIRVDKTRVNIFKWEDEAKAIAKSVYKANSTTLTKGDQDEIEEVLCQNLQWITSNEFSYKNTTYKVSDYYKGNLDISGGYLFELSSEYDELSKFKTSSGMKVMIKEPEYLYTNNTMMNYAKEYWQNFENAIQSCDGYNSLQESYLDLADFDSMISYWLTMEILGNDDAIRKSRFAYKDLKGKLQFGPAWDFDWGCGSYTVGTKATGWKVSSGTLWKEFIDDPYFQVKAAEKYWSVRKYLENIVEDNGEIDNNIQYLKEAGLATDKKYTKTTYGGSYTRRNFLSDAQCFKTYLKERLVWLDQQFAKEEMVTSSLQGQGSTCNYTKSSDKLKITLENVSKDDTSDTLKSDGIILKSEELKTVVEAFDDETKKIKVYVNGRFWKAFDIQDKCEFSIPATALTEEISSRNIISIIGYNEKNVVTNTNYVSVIQVLPEQIPGTPYRLEEDKLVYDVTVPHIIINQVYGAGDANKKGIRKGYLSNDYIELYNPTKEDVDLSNWYLYYQSSESGNASLKWEQHQLQGVIPAGCSYLVTGASINESDNKDNSLIKITGDEEWNQIIHNKGVSVMLTAKQVDLTEEKEIFDNETKKPFLDGYVDMLSISGNDDTDDENVKYCETSASHVQSKKKTIRRVNFKDSDNNSIESDCEIIDFSFENEDYIEWICPKNSSYGSWEYTTRKKPVYRVKYHCGINEGDVTEKTYEYYFVLEEPERPEKSGYIFEGWYTNAQFTEEYEFGSRPTKNVDIYVKWISIDEQKAQEIMDIIASIGEVTYTEESRAKIEEAREAYELLSKDQKAKVTEETLKVLTDAEEKYTAMKNEVLAKEEAARKEMEAKLEAADKENSNKETMKESTDRITEKGEISYTGEGNKKIDEVRKEPETKTGKKGKKQKKNNKIALSKKVSFVMNKKMKVTIKDRKIKIRWGKVKKADGYIVCMSNYGKKLLKRKKVVKRTQKVSAIFTKFAGKKIDLTQKYKVFVQAYKKQNGKQSILGKSYVICVTGTKIRKNNY